MSRSFLTQALVVLSLASATAWGCSGASAPGTTDTPDGGSPGVDAGPPVDGGGPAPDGGVTPRDSGNTVPEAGSPPPMTSAIKIIVEPTDNGSALLAAIQGATTSVHMTMYLLSNSAIISALIAQKNANHDVKVLLNKNFVNGAGSNTSVYNQLKAAGVNVSWAPLGFALTHEKCVILDGTSAWIMTMNATQSSAIDNREYLAVDTDPADVAEAEAIFQADFANTAFSASGKLVVSPDNSRSKLKALIDSAKTTIDMEAEELADDALVASLAAAQDRGVRVRVVIASGTGSANQQASIATLKQHGVKLVAVSTPYMHAKSIVADGARAYVGSENFSFSSLSGNRELGVLTDAAAEVAKVATTTAGDFAAGAPL